MTVHIKLTESVDAKNARIAKAARSVPPTAEDVKAAWLQVFPNSDCVVGKGCLGGAPYLNFYLQKKDEVANGIRENDPLSYSAWLREDGSFDEGGSPHLTIKPQEKHYAYSSVKLRKQNTKNADYPKLVKRFTAIKEFIKANEANWYLDLSDKV